MQRAAILPARPLPKIVLPIVAPASHPLGPADDPNATACNDSRFRHRLAQGPRRGQNRTHGFVVSKQGQVLVLRRDFDKPGIGGQGLSHQIDGLPSIVFMSCGHQGMDAARLVGDERIRVRLHRGVGVPQGRLAVSLAGQQYAACRHGPGIAWLSATNWSKAFIAPWVSFNRSESTCATFCKCRRGPRVELECLAKIGKCFVWLLIQTSHASRDPAEFIVGSAT